MSADRVAAVSPGLDPFITALLRRAPWMSFMQFCQLLELHRPDAPAFGQVYTSEHDPVRFRSRARTGFPVSEIASAGPDEELGETWPDAPPLVHTTFMGLYGVDAMMPSTFVDDVVQRVEGHEAVERFLDLFHHRALKALYQIWKKYRYPVGFLPGAVDAQSQRLLHYGMFTGGDRIARAGATRARPLAMLGLLAQRTRTAQGLASVIALSAPGAGVHIDEFMPVWMPATDKPGLSQTPIHSPDLAEDAADERPAVRLGQYVLGRRMRVRHFAVRATLTPTDARQARALLPGAYLYRDLIATLRLYIGIKADVLLFMTVSSHDVPPFVIGMKAREDAPLLAWTSVLRSSRAQRITIALGRYVACDEPAVHDIQDIQDIQKKGRP